MAFRLCLSLSAKCLLGRGSGTGQYRLLTIPSPRPLLAEGKSDCCEIGFILHISTEFMGLGHKPLEHWGMCHVCGNDVLLCTGGTDFKPSLG